MARIRRLTIRNFRSIQSLDWNPTPGINCLVGPGDSGKSSVLDAIDLCLGARRSAPFGDTDFFGLNVEIPIEITITLGELNDDLKNFDIYGDYLQGFDAATKAIEDEPGDGLETVLTIRLQVGSDLEPEWTLYSRRAEQNGLSRGLQWKDRSSIAPARIGAYAQTNLSWSRNSVLNRLTEERAELGAALANAARQARHSFGSQAAAPLADALELVTRTASTLGVPVGEAAQALLDAHSVSIGDGAVALHNSAGIPLRSLGTGSARLLIAGLQRAAATKTSIALVDEVEYGLEPHRLIRFLDSLGAKETEAPPLQAFITTHSPIALRELSGNQLSVIRASNGQHHIAIAGESYEIQSTLRAAPEAFLAKFVLVCEGSSEVGFIRGMDQYAVENEDRESLYALGGTYIAVGGGHPDKCFERGSALLTLGYQAIVVVDADIAPSAEKVRNFEASNGKHITWQAGHALEDELFSSVSDAAIDVMLTIAKETVGADIVAQQILSMSNGTQRLEAIEALRPNNPYPNDVRALLGQVAKNSKKNWYKSLGRFQRVAKEAVFPNFDQSQQAFRDAINELKGYINAAASA